MENLNNYDHEISKKLKDIFFKNFGIDFNDKVEEDYYKNLLSKYFRFEAKDLLDLYFYVEKEFNINIPEEDIIKGNFCSFNNIMDIISKQISVKCS